MLEKLLVGIVVAGAFAYAAWALLPRALRARLGSRMGDWGRRAGRHRWLARVAAAIERAGRSGNACGGCSAATQAKERSDPDAPRA